MEGGKGLCGLRAEIFNGQLLSSAPGTLMRTLRTVRGNEWDRKCDAPTRRPPKLGAPTFMHGRRCGRSVWERRPCAGALFAAGRPSLGRGGARAMLCAVRSDV